MTTLFCFSILCVTLSTLFLRLTVFSDLVIPTGSESSAPSAREDVEPGLFPYTLNRKINLATPDSRGDFRIHNPETNEHYMTVSIILPSTGENLFYTGFVKPGQTRDSAALHIKLPEGVYECVAEVTAYDPVTLKPRGSEERDVTLQIGRKAK